MPTTQSTLRPPGANNTIVNGISRAEEALASTMPWSSLKVINKQFKKLRPCTLARLIRNLIDSKTYEHTAFTLTCLLELFDDYLPSIEDISKDTLMSIWRFIVYLRKTHEKSTDEDNELYEAQGFVKKSERPPEFDRIANNFGLSGEKLATDFEKMEIPLMIVSGLLGIAGLFLGDKLASLIIDPKILQSSLGKTAKMIKDTTVVWSTFENTWTYIMDYIASFFGYAYISDKDQKTHDILQRLADMRSRFDNLSQLVTKDLSSLVQSEFGLLQLEMELKALETEIDRLITSSKQGFNFTHHIRDFKTQINAIKDIIIKSKNSAAGKQHPVAIRLCGPPGVGKSELAAEIVNRLSMKEERQLSAYTRNSAADSFWSGYTHQDVVIYDDYAQDAQNIDHSEMYGIFTNQAYRLNMADCPQKGTHFTSRYVILCSNIDYISNSKTILDVKALNRRTNAHYHVTSPVVEGYRREHGCIPSRDSELWKKDFSHLNIEQWRIEPRLDLQDWDEIKVIHKNRKVDEIVDMMYKQQLIEKQDYIAKMQNAKSFETILCEAKKATTNELAQKIDHFDALPQTTFDPTPINHYRDALQDIETMGYADMNDPCRLQRIQSDKKFKERCEAFAPLVLCDNVYEMKPSTSAIMPPSVTISDNPFAPLKFNAESIETKRTGCNQYLLIGPSGCGKSHLMSELLTIRKVHSIEEIMEADGTLKIDPHSNIHFEDISVTPETTNRAIEVCQRLSDHDLFCGVVVYTANPDMLYKNLSARGTEALEVFSRRCTTIEIKKRWNQYTIRGFNASNMNDQLGYGWDMLYYGVSKDNSNMTYTDIACRLITNECTIRTYAVFDNQALQDYVDQEPIELNFPGVTFEQLVAMKGYSKLRSYIDMASAIRAGIYLTTYFNLLEALPKDYVTPLQLVTVINSLNLRIPAGTPSAKLNFEDFHVKLINHRTFVLVQIVTPEITIPELSSPAPIVIQADKSRSDFFYLVFDFISMITKSVMIFRELTGWNQGEASVTTSENRGALKATQLTPKTTTPIITKQFRTKFVLFAPSGNGKTTWFSQSPLNKFFDDTDDDVFNEQGIITNDHQLINEAEYGILFLPSYKLYCKRHQVMVAEESYKMQSYQEIKEVIDKKRFDPKFVVMEITDKTMFVGNYDYEINCRVHQAYPEYEVPVRVLRLTDEGKKKNAVKRQRNDQLIARSQRQVVRKDDPSGTGTSRTQFVSSLHNEGIKRKHIVDYDLEPKHESKVLTHTDISPRYEIPDYKNIIDIPPESPYHIVNYSEIKSYPPLEQFRRFQEYIESHDLDPEMFKGDLNFVGIDTEEQNYWDNFFTDWDKNFLKPESMSDHQAAALIPILTGNQVFVLTDGQLVQRALMIYNRIGITTAHGIDANSTIQIPSSKQVFAMRIINNNTDKDLAIFQLVQQAPQFRDIRSFIRSMNDTDLLDGCDSFLLTVYPTKNNVVAQIRASKITSRTECRYNSRTRLGYLYGGTLTGFDLPLAALTEKGHCGSPGVILNSRYPRKIISIHSAGSEHNAFGLPIYKEMFEIPELQGQSLKEEIVVLKHQEITPLPVPERLGGFKLLYELNHNNSTPNQTDIFRSPLQCDIFGDNFEPSILANYDLRNIDNVSIDHVTIEKWDKPQPEKLDLETLDYVTDEWALYYKRLIQKEKLQQFKLTKTEAINRVTYYSASQPIQKDTSAGYPWRHRPNSKGKHLFVQPRSFRGTVLNCIPDDDNGRDLHHAIDSLIETCRKGQRPAVVFASSAKDEVLKKKKIYPCRTRGFAGAPIDFSIAHRQYFHTAVCALTQTRSKHPIKVGIEANGQEWNDLYSWLAKNSTVGFDADFKDWDATIPRAVMERLHKIYNAIYSACPLDPNSLEEDNKIRKHLHSVLWGPLLTLGQYVVQAPGGQVSGQPATTIDNCFVGLIIMAYAWMKLAPEHLANFKDFMDNVQIAVYGDDQVVTVKPECLDFYNLESVKQIIGEQIGMEITSAAKDGKIIKFKNLEDMEFLKRNFLKIGPYYYGKLQESAFDKMLNWTHTYRKHHYFRSPDTVHYEPQTIAESIKSMLFELCIYPPDIYEGISNHCWEVLQKLGINAHVPSQKSMLIQRGIPHELFLSTDKQKF